MDFTQVVISRRSVRKYLPECVDLEIVKQCILLWMYAPSAHNEQPWEFYVTEEKEKLEQLGGWLKYWKMLPLASCVICVAYRPKDLRSLDYVQQDLSASIQTILLALHDKWLWGVRLWTYPNEENCEVVKNAFNLWSEIQPFALISVWKPDPTEQYFEKTCEIEEKIHIM